ARPISGLTSLQASAKSNIASETRFAQQIGLYDSTQINRKLLESDISEESFQRGLNGVLLETGLFGTLSLQEMAAAGIIDAGVSAPAISRKAAAETFLRTIIYSWNRELLPKPEFEGRYTAFKDWRVEQKYHESLAFAVNSGLFQGASNGLFKPERNLKVQEALLLLQRFFDLATRNSLPIKIAIFKDVAQDHYMTAPLLNLRRAGAFDLTTLGQHLNGTKAISVKDLSLVIQGILGRLDKPAYISQIRQLERSFKQKHSATRKILACMGAVLANAVPHSESNQHILYSDVKTGTSLEKSLEVLSRAGIRMGYNNNRFAGAEKVTRYEALGLINLIISELAVESAAEPTKINTEKVATKSDFESLKQLMITRQARIRRILNRNTADEE
ncbi:MAG: S-layer homology domain-containing protein, partial [Candidatus Riflebacteria bacterium]|nr:S-layer homology domain-containing protein [Candidatus Riflebacteria bacterium]